jgi:hypothetical protein
MIRRVMNSFKVFCFDKIFLDAMINFSILIA